MSRLVYVLNGPNLNLLGKRQPHIYGHETLADVERDCRALAGELGLTLRFHQSNREYEIIDWIHEAREEAGGIVTDTLGRPLELDNGTVLASTPLLHARLLAELKPVDG